MINVNYKRCKFLGCSNKAGKSGYCYRHHKEIMVPLNDENYNYSKTTLEERKKVLYDKRYLLKPPILPK